jgi:hypothetical protein
MTTAAAAPADLATLRRQIEVQAAVVAEAEQVYARRREWAAEQRTTVSRAGEDEARRDLAFYRGSLKRLEAQLAEAAEVAR